MVIIWKKGIPTKSGKYIILNKEYRARIDYYDTDKGKWLEHEQENISVWCSAEVLNYLNIIENLKYGICK